MHENREISRAPLAVGKGRSVKAHRRTTDTHVLEKSDCAVMRAEQHVVQEGQSPSGARMRSAISESGGNASLAGGPLEHSGGQGVHQVH